LYLDVARRLFSLDENRPEMVDNEVQMSVGSNY
jgi:hypothetical protein